VAQELSDYEQRFRRAGLPFFVEDYSARGDVFTRAAPLLALVFIGEVVGAVDLRWTALQNIAATTGALVALLVAFGLINRMRGRPFRSVPDTVGASELTAFVVLPALLPLVFNGQVTSAVVTMAGNALLLLVIYGVVGYRLLSIVRWAGERLASQLIASLELLTRALPLLLVFANVLFLTSELWVVAHTVPTAFAVLTMVLLLGLVGAFLLARIPREVRSIERDAAVEAPPLRPRERANVGLVMIVSQALQVAVVSVAVGAFFIVLGLLLVNSSVRQYLMDSNGHVLFDFHLLGHKVEMTRELIRVSVGIAAFSGLYYAVTVLTDSTYREEFIDELTDEMRETFKLRAEYLSARDSSAT
jgi:hypothetical protein